MNNKTILVFAAALLSVATLGACGTPSSSEPSSSSPSSTSEVVHNYSEEWSYDADKHWHACTDSGFESLKSGEANHDYVLQEGHPASLENFQLLEHYQCSVCGAKAFKSGDVYTLTDSEHITIYGAAAEIGDVSDVYGCEQVEVALTIWYGSTFVMDQVVDYRGTPYNIVKMVDNATDVEVLTDESVNPIVFLEAQDETILAATTIAKMQSLGGFIVSENVVPHYASSFSADLAVDEGASLSVGESVFVKISTAKYSASVIDILNESHSLAAGESAVVIFKLTVSGNTLLIDNNVDVDVLASDGTTEIGWAVTGTLIDEYLLKESEVAFKDSYLSSTTSFRASAPAPTANDLYFTEDIPNDKRDFVVAWYTSAGVRMPSAPSASGTYIVSIFLKADASLFASGEKAFVKS